MSTTMRNVGIAARGEALAQRRAAAGPHPSSGFAQWIAAHAGLICVASSALYVATVLGLTLVLSASATATPIGMAVVTLFVLEVLLFVAMAIYVMLPER